MKDAKDKRPYVRFPEVVPSSWKRDKDKKEVLIVPKLMQDVNTISPVVRKESYWAPASEWSEFHTSALHIYFELLKTPNDMIPEKFFLGDEKLDEKYGALLSPQINKEKLKNKTFLSTGNKIVDYFFVQVWKLCKEKALIKRTKTEEELAQDKDEQYTVTLWNFFALCFHDIDSITSSLFLQPHLKIDLKVHPLLKSTCIIDSAVMEEKTRSLDKINAFEESKRYKPSKSVHQLLAQKASEGLASAQYNQDGSDCAQEVFGIGVGHFYFEFWHSLIPAEYLEKLQLGYELNSNELLPFHCFRGASAMDFEVNSGLDIRDPIQRREIVRIFDALLSYVENGEALIGKWNN